MAKKTNAWKVRLVRGASFVIPDHRFLPGITYTVVDEKVLEALKRSQQFSIKDADDADDDDEPEVEENEAGEEPEPAKKPKRKKRR